MTDPVSPDDDALAAALQRSRVLHDAPEPLISRAIGLFQARAAAPAATTPATGAGATLRRLVAVLSFDSAGAAPLAFGRRGRAQPVRQLLYSVDGRDIDLRLSATDSAATPRWRIAGQVLGPDRHGQAELVQDHASRRAEWDALGEFAFDDLGPGTWTLRLQGADWSVELPVLELAAPRA